ncbi:hypothetical protein ACETAC_07835 [Aceticella autotrophica]|uniref:Uncharacterized protein n=1 Tax=Aceticella autotrophica TaxID=2755338 RepID=A0A975AUP4_9THEO|nr:hypothetical protein [Aceticella autotrophica]QSZ26794.1 hypothetical protein ACETAC_07835 [Aceticella autotrophica]
MLKLIILTVIFIIISVIVFLPLFKEKKWKELIISFIFISISYVMYLLWMFDLTIEPLSKVVSIFHSPMISLWNKLNILCK